MEYGVRYYRLCIKPNEYKENEERTTRFSHRTFYKFALYFINFLSVTKRTPSLSPAYFASSEPRL